MRYTAAMDWNALDLDRLAKVMALAASSEDGEALAALRRARVILGKAGGSFASVATALRTKDAPVPTDGLTEAMMERVRRTEGRIRTLEQENEMLRRQFDEAVRYIIEVERKLSFLKVTGGRSDGSDEG
ncbi:MAG: hypothetical protein HQL38_18435 [Alphaproteobacteria bacterium]|nr:hypothetical protein [Alphaproteobacteria bacterium]